MIKNGEIYDFLCEKYPLNTACDFDNPGFLVGDKNGETEKVLVCLDCEITAVKKAVDLGARLIVTHHPVIFNPIKSVLAGSTVYELIKNGISVISMHTNLDIAEGGVNDCLCDALELENKEIFEASDGFKLRKVTFDAPESPDAFAKKAKEKSGFSVRYTSGRPIKTALVCCGAGGDYIDDAVSGDFDALITADTKHHQMLIATDNNISLFDLGHYASENVVIKPLAKRLSAQFPNAEFITYSPDLIKSI